MTSNVEDSAYGREPARSVLTSVVCGEDVTAVTELAVLADPVATVRVSLDTQGMSARLVVEDVGSGEQVVVGAAELFQLIVEARADDSWAVWRTS